MGEAFEFPDFYHYPPYFTLQPVKETRERQLASWRELILSWCRHGRVYELVAAEFPLFENAAIDRKLNAAAREAIIKDLLDSDRAVVIGESVYVLWRSESEWEKALMDWAHRTGVSDDVRTVDELCDGDEVEGEPFHSMPKALMKRVLQRLEQAGKVALFQGTAQDDEGVKFL